MNDTDDDATHSVRTVTGAGGERRTYTCSCGHVWTQTRPDALEEQEDPRIVVTEQCFRILGGRKRGKTGGGYRCGKCGQIKLGHVCQQQQQKKKKKIAKKSVRSAATPALVAPGPATPQRAAPFPQPTAPARTVAPGPAAPPSQSAAPEPAAPDRVTPNSATRLVIGATMAADMRLLLSAPFTAAQYLAFLEKYDLKPSHAAHIQRCIQSTPAFDIEHITNGVQKHTLAYLTWIDDELKVMHLKLLEKPEDRQLLLARKDGSPVALALFTSGRRGTVDLVHTLRPHRERGYARRLAQKVQSLVPPNGSLTVDSPWCTARAAIVLWLGVGFIGDEDLLKCELREDAAYDATNTKRSVRITLSWRPGMDKTTHAQYLRRVAEAHPDLKRIRVENGV